MTAPRHPTASGRHIPWSRFASDLIVPALLLGYATQFYISVARLPRPETNLLLIGPVYWLLLLCCVIYVALRLIEVLRSRQGDVVSGEEAPARIDLPKSLSFILLTGACIWAIPVIGFVTATFAYTFLLLLALGVRSLPVLVLTPSLLVGLLWFGMEHYLNLRLPTGLLI